MYTVTKNTKLISLVLMLIGVVALGYGFMQGAGHHTDEEIAHEVEAFAHDLHLDGTHHVDTHDAHAAVSHDGHGAVEEAHYAPLFHLIEKQFNLHFSHEEMMEAHDLEHVVHATTHALHAKGQRPWSSLLVAAIFFLGASLLAVFFLALQYVAEVGWSVVLKRIMMAIGSFLPYVAVVFFLIFITGNFHLFGNHTYHWMAEGIMDTTSPNFDAIIAGKEAYLNAPFFIIRTIIYLLGWNYFAKKLRSLSLLEDKQGGTDIHFKGVRASAWFMVFFAITS